MPDALNEVGMTEYYLEDSGVVTGGCRTTTANSSEWLCYVGQRAVDEDIISGALLGTRQPPRVRCRLTPGIADGSIALCPHERRGQAGRESSTL
jgi:hypothetical protein